MRRNEKGAPLTPKRADFGGGDLRARTKSRHQIRLSPEDREEAAAISREIRPDLAGSHVGGGFKAGESAAAGVGEILGAARRFRERTGRALLPKDIDDLPGKAASNG